MLRVGRAIPGGAVDLGGRRWVRRREPRGRGRLEHSAPASTAPPPMPRARCHHRTQWRVRRSVGRARRPRLANGYLHTVAADTAIPYEWPRRECNHSQAGRKAGQQQPSRQIRGRRVCLQGRAVGERRALRLGPGPSPLRARVLAWRLDIECPIQLVISSIHR